MGVEHIVRRARLRREANAFRIWRAGKARGWKCSFEDLARATGLTVRTVQRHCEDRGWIPQHDYDGGIPLAVDRMMRLSRYFRPRIQNAPQILRHKLQSPYVEWFK